MTQSLGVALAAAGAWLLWSPWALVVAGVLLVVAPEVGALLERRRLAMLEAAALRARRGAR